MWVRSERLVESRMALSAMFIFVGIYRQSVNVLSSIAAMPCATKGQYDREPVFNHVNNVLLSVQ